MPEDKSKEVKPEKNMPEDKSKEVKPPETPVVIAPDEPPEVVVEVVEEEGKREQEVFGMRQAVRDPDDSPLNTNGYVGVDPNFQRDPLK